MRAEKVGAETLLSKIVAMVVEAQRTRAPIQRLADVVVPVSAIGIALYDLTKTAELLKRGRAAAEKSLPAIRRLLDA